MRIVLDTNVLCAALRSSSGASFRILDAVAERRLTLLATPPIFFEYEDVLKRPEQMAAHGRNPAWLDDFLGELAALICPVDLNFRWRPQLRDPNDEMFVEAAVNGGAKAIVTFNSRDFGDVANSFGIMVWSPRQAYEAFRS